MCPSIGGERPVNTLAKFGYNTQEAYALRSIVDKNKKTSYLRKNLETTINHLYEDSVISFASHYQLNTKGEIVTYPDYVPLHLDPEERGDLYREGLTSAINDSITHPYKVITYYSPPGPLVFDNAPENKYKDIDPYKIGQLYLMYSDGVKVNNVAIGISEEGEDWVQKLMPDQYNKAKKQSDEINQIKYFITHHKLHDEDIETFITDQYSKLNRPIYLNKDGIHFDLHKTMLLMRQSFTNTLPHSEIVDTIMNEVDIEKITPKDISGIYNQAMILYMKKNELTTLSLGGSCGGKEVSLNQLYELDVDALTTNYRLITQGNIIPESNNRMKDRYDDYDCPSCGSSITGELVGKPETWKNACPHCHSALHCAKT